MCQVTLQTFHSTNACDSGDSAYLILHYCKAVESNKTELIRFIVKVTLSS